MSWYQDVFPSSWMTGDDIAEGETLTLKIRMLQKQTVGKDREQKPVLLWTDKGFKPLIVNRTNGKMLIELFGLDEKAYAGKRVQLYSVALQVGDEMKRGVRISKHLPKDGQPTLVAPEPEDEGEEPVDEELPF
jgi:hypothetical protein